MSFYIPPVTDTWSTQYQYDPTTGQLTKKILPGGQRLTCHYQPDGKLRDIQHSVRV